MLNVINGLTKSSATDYRYSLAKSLSDAGGLYLLAVGKAMYQCMP